MPVKSDREYRSFLLGDFEKRKAEDGQMVIEGYATVFGTEYCLWSEPRYKVMESIDPNCFANADMSDVILQYDHEGRVFARIRNKTLSLDVDDHGLKVTARLDGTTIGRQLYEEIVGGYTDRMSFGFVVAKDQRTIEEDANGNVILHRVITEISKVYDVSVVSLPANDATEISARSLSDGLIKEAVEELNAIKARKKLIDEINALLEDD